MAKLTFILQDGQEVEVLLRKEITIGRSEDNEVVVDAPLISARHACVKRAGPGDFEVCDLQSEGGTFVNDERVDHQVLEHGDRLTFGLVEAVFARETEDSRFDWLESDGVGLEEPMAVNLNEHGHGHGRASKLEKLDLDMIAAMERVAACEAELSTKENRLVEVRSTLTQAEEISRDLLDELQVLETRRDTLMGQLRDAHGRLEAMQAAFTQAEEGRAMHEERLVGLKEEILQAEEARAVAVDNRARAEADFAVEHERLEEMRREANDAGERLVVVTGQLQQVTEEERRRGDEVERLLEEEQRLVAMTADMAEVEAQLDRKQRAFSELNAEFDLKHDQWLELLNQHETSAAECDEMRNRHAETAVALQAVLMQRDEASNSLEAICSEIDGAVTRLAEVSAELVGRQGEVNAFQGQLVHLQSTRDAIQQRVDALVGKEQSLIEASAKLELAIASERELQSSIAMLTAQRADDERNLAKITLSLERLEYDAEHEALKLRDLQDQTSSEQGRLVQVSEELTKASEGLQSVYQETTRVKQELEGCRLDLETELKRLTTEVETMAVRLDEVSQRRAEIARQCEELADTEQKLGGVTSELGDRCAEKVALDQRIAELMEQREGLEHSVDGLTIKEEASKGRLEILLQREQALKQSIDSLGQEERVDRERFEAIQHLIVEAEREKRGQADRLEREVLLKQRQLIEIEDKLDPLLRWKETMDQRYARLQSLPDSSDEANALWQQLEADKVQAGQIFNQSGGSGTTSYQHGPALRGHARQLEAKIRRDEERHATLRRKVEQLEAEETERSGRLSNLERRLAMLRVDIARVERENVELEFEAPEAVIEPDVVKGKGVLGNIIEGARTKLRPMRSPNQVGAQR